MASSVPPREAITAYAYGDYREFLAVSASIMDAAVAISNLSPDKKGGRGELNFQVYGKSSYT